MTSVPDPRSGVAAEKMARPRVTAIGTGRPARQDDSGVRPGAGTESSEPARTAASVTIAAATIPR